MKMIARISLASLAGLMASTVAVASTIIPAMRPAKPVLLQGGTVVTVSGAVLPATDVLLRDGLIAQIGPNLIAPADAEVLPIAGKFVYPGLIASATQLGLSEIGAVRATVDIAETAVINPNIRAQVAINPDSELIPVARTNGVLTALSMPRARGPGSGPEPGLITGNSVLLRLDGWTWEDMTIKPMAALHIEWPEMAVDRDPDASPSAEKQQKDIDAQLRLLDESFAAARAYAKAKDAQSSAGARAADIDLRWEAMLPVLRGARPLFVRARTEQQIRSALAWSRRQGLKITLLDALDAWRVAAELREADVPVILGGTHPLPLRRDDGYAVNFEAPGKLHAAGVRFAIANGFEGSSEEGNERNLPYQAAIAVAYGLPHDVALRSITLSAAELLGVGDELGSVEVGKRATLIVTDGDPLEIPTQVEMAFVDGAAIDLNNRQSMLAEKYGERLQRLEAAR